MKFKLLLYCCYCNMSQLHESDTFLISDLWQFVTQSYIYEHIYQKNVLISQLMTFLEVKALGKVM